MNLITGLSKSFSAGQSFFLGLSQVIGQAHNCVLTCICHCIFIFLTVLGTARVVLGVSMQLEDLTLPGCWANLEMPLLCLLYWNIVRVSVSCFGWWTVCSPSGILRKTSTREASICVGTLNVSSSPRSPCRVKFSKWASWKMLWVPCSEMFGFHSPIEYHLWGQKSIYILSSSPDGAISLRVRKRTQF